MSLPRLLVAFLWVGGLLGPAIPVQASPAMAVNLACGCAFGYSAEQVLPNQWIDITSTGSVLTFPQPDDAVVSQPIGFSFRFFENEYTEAFVSTNGFISFGAQNTAKAYPINFPIPSEFPPNNIIAGFWDDLTVGGNYNNGKVYYQLTGVSPNRKAVFEWAGVTRLKGGTDALTFEIIISETTYGITLNYNSLAGDLTKATVGIEDADGVDGCQLLYNVTGLGSTQSYHLTYPVAGARVKAKPLYQGQFLVNGSVDLPFTLTNTGTSADSFHFQANVLNGANDWAINVVTANKTPLTNTPTLSAGGSYAAFIRVKAAKSAPVGSYVKGQLTVVSNANGSKAFSIKFDTAIPAPFAAFYVDSSAGYVRYIMPHLQTVTQVFSSFTGSTLAISHTNGLKHMISWEDIRSGPTNTYENIQKALIRPLISPAIASLIDHSTDPDSVYDTNPMMAVLPDETVGMVFVRYTPGQGSKLVPNVFFARMDSNGNILPPIVQVTENNNPDLEYNLPVIATSTTPNDRFVIAYETKTPLGGSSFARDIDAAVLSSDGLVLFGGPKHVTTSQGSGFEFYTPTVAQMNGGDVFIAFQSYQVATQLDQLKYSAINPNTGSIGTVATLDVNGGSPRAVTLSGGNILLAWITDTSLSIGYSLFDPSGILLNPDQPFSTLDSANGWTIENISLSEEINGNGVITWQDEWGYFLYYALVAPEGALITPAMAFVKGSNPSSPNIMSSSTGKGIAQLDLFWPAFMPIIMK